MNFINKSFDIINEAAFGDISKKVTAGWEHFGNIFNFMMNPIGLLYKSHDFMLQQVRRNIGTVNGLYDGYGTPIGEVSNPFYNSIVMTPWFMLDESKQMTSNYIEYVKKTYGASLSVENINIPHSLRVDGRASMVASIPLNEIIGKNPVFINLNQNGTNDDTKLGKVSAYYVSETLSNAIAGNDLKFGKVTGIDADGTQIEEDSSMSKGITKTLYYYFGLKSDSFENALSSFSKGKSIDGINTLSDNSELTGPIDNSNYGIIESIGTYEKFYNSLNDITKGYYKDNIRGHRIDKQGVKYYPQIENNDNYNIYSSAKVNSSHDIFKDVIRIYEEKAQVSGSFNRGTAVSRYSTFDNTLVANDLLRKTNEYFKAGKIKTILGKFHTDKDASDENSITQTAVSKEYGMSHGRNLRKGKNGKAIVSEDNGYDNPYCRVWTYHHQYSTLKDLIRPFAEAGENNEFHLVSQSELATKYGFDQFEAFHNIKGFPNGRSRLEEHGVLNKRNGLVNISPIEDGIADNKVDIKNCMFSIENLAWKDTLTGISSYNVETISDEQKGPFGGRIMWFPPYDLKFNEDVNVSWAETSFIGRGESIYTYKNTKRTGTISFKLLIDHPSILNYWTNAGNNTDGIDDFAKGNEQELLRFFAGCDFLTPRVEKKKEKETATTDEPISTPNTETYTFFVFFPNNYSGADDSAEKAMEYLINGYATWRTDKGDYYSPSNTAKAILKPKDIQVGGYEMRPGISLNYPFTEKDYGKYDYIGSVEYGNSKIVSFVPIKGNGGDVKYYYRVDSKYASIPLTGGNSNYMDLSTNSASLNSKYGIDTVKEFAIGKSDNVFSFVDFYVAMQADVTMDTLGGLYNQINYNLIRSRIKDRKKYITNVLCTGSASKPGGDNKKLARNRANKVKEWLSSGGVKICDKSKIKVEVSDDFGGDDNVNSITSKLYRHVRVDIELSTEEANATQNLAKDEYTNFKQGQANAEKKVVKGDEKVLDKNNTSFTDMASDPYYDSPLFKIGKEMFSSWGNYHGGFDFNIGQPNATGKKGSNLQGQNNYVDPSQNPNNEDYKSVSDNQNEMHTNESKKFDNAEKESKGRYNTNSTGTEAVGNKRYEGEAQFFELLELNNPFLHHKIREKIKYFDPAFHSVSPEGFNARLTFLQQCCRQGPTNGASDSGAENTATNLAFGRPPVCILRIGDFFYTKIIIEGVTIDYSSNGLQWDLNPEGIGVMPMMADVTIRFNFIGGSSLAGPISRLQNALSFNMYANTEVYDDRAELAKYDTNTGEITELAPFNPSV